MPNECLCQKVIVHNAIKFQIHGRMRFLGERDEWLLFAPNGVDSEDNEREEGGRASIHQSRRLG